MDEFHRRLPPVSPAVRALPVACVVVAIMVGCGGGEGSAAQAEASGCKQVKALRPRRLAFKAPKQTVQPGEKLTAVVKTSCGSFDIALDTKQAPRTVNSFVFLANKGFYDGLSFERAAVDGLLEGGGPPGDASDPGYTVKGELPPRLRYTKGTVAMAQPAGAQPSQVGSQFFVVLAPYLDFSPLYPPLGMVDRGLGVVRRITEFGPPASTRATLGYSGPVGELRKAVLIEGVSIKGGIGQPWAKLPL
jgi:cyclophilin family peptidyl-prolyl cis-trans isomerase